MSACLKLMIDVHGIIFKFTEKLVQMGAQNCKPMRIKNLILFLGLFIAAGPVFAQHRSIKSAVYFDSDKDMLRPESKKRIDSLVQAVAQADIEKIYLRGNTDNTADSLYNIRLSDRRTTAIKKYMVSKSISAEVFNTDYYGKNKPIASNDNEAGKQKNRRVDIMIMIRVKLPEVKQDKDNRTTTAKVTDDDLARKKADSLAKECQRDTAITLPEGTMLVMNKCEYLVKKDCYTITEMNTPKSIKENDMVTRDVLGNPLVSVGMVSIMPKEGCDPGCFDKPVVVRFPLISSCRPISNLQAYTWIARNRAWQVQGSRINYVTINGQQYVEITVKCPGKINGDYCCSGQKEAKQVKFKAPKGYNMVKLNISVSSTCTRGMYDIRQNRRRHNIAKGKIPCAAGNGIVFGFLVNPHGDTMVLANKPLSDFKARKAFARCAPYFLFIQRGPGSFYRKYLIRPQDLISIREYRMSQQAEVGKN